VHVIVTAGHVDHGKSMLVRALTGMEPDRWEAEQQRGMTIDLGFAWMTLPSGERLAFVDVPGHERFVSNMLAGAGPAPAVMFVVAADEGWMPQSAEHLAALDALGVRDGLLVVTRADLADPEPALREAAGQIAGTSLGPDIEAVAVSALDGRGMPGLIAALDRLAGRLPRPDPRSAVRLWLDRVFAIKGSGTVVTGTLQAGTVRNGDELTLTPAARPVRIRGVQSLGEQAGQVSGVARVALNLRGVSTRELGRGMALVRPGTWTMTSAIDVRVAPHSRPRHGEGPLRLPPKLTLHIGAARTVARVRVLGGLGRGGGAGASRAWGGGAGAGGAWGGGAGAGGAWGGGAGAGGAWGGGAGAGTVLRLNLGHALPLHVGDRVLLRDPGGAAGPAGGPPIYGATVLDVLPPPLRGTGAAAAAERELASWPDPPAAADLLRRHRLLRASTAAAMGLTDLPPQVSDGWLADPEHWQRLRHRLAAVVTAHAARDPLAAGLPVDAARTELGLPDRGLIGALAAWPTGDPADAVEMSGGYLRRATPAAGQPRGGTGPPQPPGASGTARPAGPRPAGVPGSPRPAGVPGTSGAARPAGTPGPVRRQAGVPGTPHGAPGPGSAQGGGARGTAQRGGAPGTTQSGAVPGTAQSGAVPGTAQSGAAPGPGHPGSVPAQPGPALPPRVAEAVRAVLADLADTPFRAPDAPRLAELGLDARAAAAAERAGLLYRLPGNVILAAGAIGQAARILTRLPQPFTTAEARQALGTTRRVAIPLLEQMDRNGITRRLPDDRRMMREH
jgi:selenocysteine-specific elongation factor